MATFGHSHIHDSVQKALTEERNLQEQRNRKVLQLLQEKDGMIHELQIERGRLNAEVILCFCLPCVAICCIERACNPS